jgi:hypothetical protein
MKMTIDLAVCLRGGPVIVMVLEPVIKAGL